MIQRKPAFKVWISDLSGGELLQEPGEFGMHYLTLKGNNVSRVNLIGNVVDVFFNPEKGFSSVAVDDGSGAVNVRAFKEDSTMLEGLKIGDMVTIIGRIREYNNDRYILPEIVKVISDPNWELVRKLELLKEHGLPKQQELKQIVEVKAENAVVAESVGGTVVEEVGNVTSSVRGKILSLIEKADENGADHSFILSSLGLPEQEVGAVLKELLSEGEIYQNRPGKYKVI